MLLPPLHAFEPQEIPPADEVVLGGGGIAAAGGAAEAGVEHTPPVPAIGGCADVDAQGLIPPGGQGRGRVAGGAEVHFHQIHPHRCKTAAPGQHGAGDPLQLGQMGRSPAEGGGLVCRRAGRVQIREHGVPHGQLVGLVGGGVAGSADVEPQSVGGKRGSGVELGAAPAQQALQTDAERERTAECDAPDSHLAAG